MTSNNVNTRLLSDTYADVAADTNREVDPFMGSTSMSSLYRRAERLALATHVVSNLVPYREEIRNTIRRESRQLLSRTLELYTGTNASPQQAAQDVLVSVRHILSLIDILHVTGHVSRMNTEVLKHAYRDFALAIERIHDAPTAEAIVVKDEFFETLPTQSKGQPIKDISKGHTEGSITDTLKDTESIKDIKDTERKTVHRTQSIRDKRRLASRRMQILDVVTKRGPVPMATIAKEIPDCSQKTLQRELLSLVADNVIAKEGEKRWTMYSIAG